MFFSQRFDDFNAGVGVFVAEEWIEKVVNVNRVNG